MNEPLVTFWSLKAGERFDDGVTMWGFVKVGRFTAEFVDMDTRAFFLPWTKVKRVIDVNEPQPTNG